MKKIAVIVSILALGGCSGGSTPQNWICEGNTENESDGDKWTTKFASSVQIKDGMLWLDGSIVTLSRPIPLVQTCASTSEKEILETACIFEGGLVYKSQTESLGIQYFFMNLTTGVYERLWRYRVPAMGGKPSFGIRESTTGVCQPLDS